MATKVHVVQTFEEVLRGILTDRHFLRMISKLKSKWLQAMFYYVPFMVLILLWEITPASVGLLLLRLLLLLLRSQL